MPLKEDLDQLELLKKSWNEKNNHSVHSISFELLDLLSLILKEYDRVGIAEIIKHRWFTKN